jgi:hypothetical protein
VYIYIIYLNKDKSAPRYREEKEGNFWGDQTLFSRLRSITKPDFPTAENHL